MGATISQTIAHHDDEVYENPQHITDKKSPHNDKVLTEVKKRKHNDVDEQREDVLECGIKWYQLPSTCKVVAQPPVRPEDWVGKNIMIVWAIFDRPDVKNPRKKRWIKTKKWYKGSVLEYNVNTEQHLIVYERDEGTEEKASNFKPKPFRLDVNKYGTDPEGDVFNWFLYSD